MKKKLKDLTEEEIQRVCDSHNSCSDCQLGRFRHIHDCLVDYLELEINVPEEEEK